MDEIWIDYLSGVFGGIAVVLIGHPFDTTKTRLQTSPPNFYVNTMDCVSKTIKWEGVYGLYKGILSPLFGQMVFRSASFGTFSATVKWLSSSDDSLSNPTTPSQLLLAGSITGLIISVIEAPIDLVKTKMQIQIFSTRLNPSHPPLYTGVLGCVRHTVHSYGLKGLWQGWSATAIRNIPANGLFFPVNELAKRAIAQRNGVTVSELQVHHRLLCGAAAGLGYWVATYPLDAIKGRMQSLPFEDQGGWLGTARAMAREGGWRAFTRGLAPCAARAVPACAAMFTTVDVVKDALTQKL